MIGPEPVLRVPCQRRRWWMDLVALVRGRARSKDPLFEAHVRVWCSGPGAPRTARPNPTPTAAWTDGAPDYTRKLARSTPYAEWFAALGESPGSRDTLGRMDDTVQVQCPYCFELVELYIDPQQRGEMVQDCDVCCHPWRVMVRRRRDGSPAVTVERAQ